MPPLVGRDKPFETLRALAAAATKGRGGLALVRGAAGMGKTRLAEEIAEQAASWGLDVAWCTCWQGDGVPAFWPWIQCLRDLGLDDDADLLATGAATPLTNESSATRLLLFDSVGRDLIAIARTRPVLVVIEDLHWADTGSIQILRVLAERLSTVPLLAVATVRTDEAPNDAVAAEQVAALASRATVVDLQPLAMADVADLARGLGTRADPVELHRRSGGNPLFITELARLYDADQSLAGVPPAVGEVIELRLARLTAETRRTLETASIAATVGPRGTIALLSAATDHEPGEVLTALREAMRAGLVTLKGGTWEFAHPLVRDVVEQRLSDQAGAGLYLRIANAIEVLGVAAEHTAQLAHLLSAAALFDNSVRERAVDWNRRAAAHAVQVLAFEHAVAFYQRALALMPDGDVAARIDVLLALGAALMSSGAERAARETFDAAAAQAREHHRMDDLARAALAPGGFEVRMFDHHQIGLLHEALRGVGPEDSAFRAQLLARLAVAETFLVEPAQRREGSSEAIAIARRLDVPAVLGAALAAHLDIIAGPQYVAERLALAEELMEVARSTGARQLEALGLRFRVVALMEVGDLERVRAKRSARGSR